MIKEEYGMLEEIKRLDNTLQNEIKRKEQGIKILEAEIDQLYDFIKEVQRLGEIEQIRINGLKDSDEYYDHSKVLEILDEVNKESVNER